MLLQNIIMIVRSSAVLLTRAVKLDASDVIFASWFYTANLFPISDWNMGPKMLASKSWHFLSHFQS